MDVLEQISSVLTRIKNKLSILIRLEHFPALVTSKGFFCTRDININNTRWYFSIDLQKYCQTSGEYIIITPDSSDQPETVGVFIHGEQHNVFEKDSFVVEVQFKFKQVPMDKGHNFTRKFCLNSSNNYACCWGTSKLAKIEVAFIFTFLIKLNNI